MSIQKGVQSVLFNLNARNASKFGSTTVSRNSSYCFFALSASYWLTLCESNSVSQIALNYFSEFFLLKTIPSGEISVAARHILYDKVDLSINLSSIVTSNCLHSALNWTLRASSALMERKALDVAVGTLIQAAGNWCLVLLNLTSVKSPAHIAWLTSSWITNINIKHHTNLTSLSQRNGIISLSAWNT